MRCLDVAREAADWVRANRAPAFLHLRTVRLMGHAGSDVESGYRARSEIVADYDRDPVLATAKTLVRHGILTPDEVVTRYEAKRDEVARVAEDALTRRKLANAAEVMASIAQDDPEAVERRAASSDQDARARAFGGKPPEAEGP
ncbi:thiamine pyrophosphate-dependent enzyme [Saccharopolyspora spinosporotrichia]